MAQNLAPEVERRSSALHTLESAVQRLPEFQRAQGLRLLAELDGHFQSGVPNAWRPTMSKVRELIMAGSAPVDMETPSADDPPTGHGGSCASKRRRRRGCAESEVEAEVMCVHSRAGAGLPISAVVGDSSEEEAVIVSALPRRRPFVAGCRVRRRPRWGPLPGRAAVSRARRFGARRVPRKARRAPLPQGLTIDVDTPLDVEDLTPPPLPKRRCPTMVRQLARKSNRRPAIAAASTSVEPSAAASGAPTWDIGFWAPPSPPASPAPLQTGIDGLSVEPMQLPKANASDSDDDRPLKATAGWPRALCRSVSSTPSCAVDDETRATPQLQPEAGKVLDVARVSSGCYCETTPVRRRPLPRSPSPVRARQGPPLLPDFSDDDTPLASLGKGCGAGTAGVARLDARPSQSSQGCAAVSDDDLPLTAFGSQSPSDRIARLLGSPAVIFLSGHDSPSPCSDPGNDADEERVGPPAAHVGLTQQCVANGEISVQASNPAKSERDDRFGPDGEILEKGCAEEYTELVWWHDGFIQALQQWANTNAAAAGNAAPHGTGHVTPPPPAAS